MKGILSANKNERAQYFREAAARSDAIKNPVIFEKDFWVCWTLNRIFSNKNLSPHITFKGGTSLSKCYGMIDRFSEDIDLTLSKAFIGMTYENDPANVTGTNQRGKRLKQLSSNARLCIENEVKPVLIDQFKFHLSNYFDDNEWQLVTSEDDQQTLIFYYPSSLSNTSNEYIQSAVKLEFGARGDIHPCETKIISPYVQQILPELFSSTEITTTTLVAKRTFWEKVTLLHAEHHREPTKTITARMFRHYYDIVMLDTHQVTQAAIEDIELLNDVVKNKTVYFPSKKALYDKARIGSICMYPNDAHLQQLKQDHAKMQEMFFGEPPNFHEVMNRVKAIEEIINKS